MRTMRATVLAVAVFMALLVARPAMAGGIDGVMLQHGKMMLMKAGKPTAPLKSDFRTHNGTTVRRDGTVTTSDGTITHLEDGQMMMMDGKIMQGGKATGMANH